MKNATKLPLDCSVGRRRAHEAHRRRRENWMPKMQAMHFSRRPQQNTFVEDMMAAMAKMMGKRKTP